MLKVIEGPHKTYYLQVINQNQRLIEAKDLIIKTAVITQILPSVK